MKISVDIINKSIYKDYMPGTYVRRPLLKIYFDNGFGLYILNADKFRWFPRFYGMFRDSFWEFGFYIFKFDFEVMWNKAFKVNAK